MAVPLSAYWVKFFVEAGFPRDVATKHAVVFSNNRIKPDMLPDLDKPSLKEMGITLMGDMIAILRYAKKVVEETTCEKFLVDSKDPPVAKVTSKPVVNKPVSKIITRSIASTKGRVEVQKNNIVKKSLQPTPTPPVTKKKTAPTTQVISHYIEKEKTLTNLKRKLDSGPTNYESSDDNEDWEPVSPKKKVLGNNGCKVIVPETTVLKSKNVLKKVVDQKRTVFDRLGDSSVTSTTNLAETTPTFNVTGLGNDVVKRNSSVFNRLGDKEGKKDQLPYVGILKNSTESTATPGILKKSPARVGNMVLTTKKVIKVSGKPIGTMRADQEKKQKLAAARMKRFIHLRNMGFNNNGDNTLNVVRKVPTTSKLASQQASPLPAKARLGTTGTVPIKQVTFKKTATVAHISKAGVFSRLGL